MKKMIRKKILVLFICVLCIIPLNHPYINRNQTTPEKIFLLNDLNSNDFYVYHGITNNFIANLNESNQGPRFQSYYGSFGGYWIRYNWQDVVGGSTNYEILYPNHPGNLVKVQWLYDHGINISIKVLGGQYNPLDLYYNSTYRQEIINQGIQSLQTYSYINDVSTIEIGDEAPATLYGWNTLPAAADTPIYSKYNSTLHTETGIWMRTDYVNNLTESWIFENWLDNKTMTAMNSIYYGLKQVFPNKQIVWSTIPWPGFEPTLLKSDAVGGGYYTNDFRTFYSEIRAAKLANPNVPVYSVITGSSDVPLNIQEQFFWTAYFAGGAGVFWGNAGNNLIWNSIGNTADLTNYEFHNNLDKLAASLPVLNPKPQVLQINEVRGSVLTPVVGFRQYDVSTELLAGSSGFSLNQYKMVVINNQYRLIDSFTSKLTNYFNSGGNILIKGWLQPFGNPNNASGQPRSVFLPGEIGSSIKSTQRSDAQLLNFQNTVLNSIIPNVKVSNRVSLNFTSSPDWIPISTGLPEEAQGYYPLAIYHNSSNPQSGYMLYYGFANNNDNDFYIPFLRDYIQNYLQLNDIVTPATNPNILISTSLDDSNRTIVGIVPDATSSTEYIPINITRRNLPQNNVWIYEGFNETPWLGTAYYPSDPSGTAQFSTIIDPYTPQRWVFTPEYPSPRPDLKVSLKYPSADPYVGEEIPITVYVDEGIQYANLDKFSIKLTFPQQCTLSSSSPPANQSLSQLTSNTRTAFQWLVTSNSPGLYNFNIGIASANLTRTLIYNFKLRINEGRTDIMMPNIEYITPQDRLTVQGSIIYHGKNPGFLDINGQIEDYIWGNTGGWVENRSMNSGDIYNFNYLSGAYGYKAGEEGVYSIWAYNQNHTTIAEGHTLIKVYSALLNATDLAMNGNNIVSNVSVRGNDYINNINAKLFLYGSELKNSDKYLGTLGPNSPQLLSWNVPNLPNKSIITLQITGNGVPSIERNYQLLIFTSPTPIYITTTITESGSTVTSISTSISTTTVFQPVSVTETVTSVLTTTVTNSNQGTSTSSTSSQSTSTNTISSKNTNTSTSSKSRNSPGFELIPICMVLIISSGYVMRKRRKK